MFEQLECIRIAAQVLAVRDSAFTDRLLRACETLWEQMYQTNDWPAEFEAQANALVNQLTAHRSIEATLDALSETAANDVAEEIVRFANKIDAQCGVAV